MQAARGASLNPSGDAVDEAGDHPNPRPTRVRLFIVTALCAYTVDVLSKVVVVATLTDHQPVTVIPGVLSLDLLRNGGAAFSVGTGLTLFLTLVAICVVIAVIRMSSRLRDTGWALAFGFLLAGAMGNLTDRVFRAPGPLRGHVVDFLQLPHWPVFNVADTCICIAAVLVAVQSLRGIGLDGSRVRDDRTQQ
ncbi:MAG: signal peptidase II [Nocardioidaceae bacterium]